MSSTGIITESDILADVIDADQGDFSPAVARSVLRWRFSDRSVKRMNELAERNSRGTIKDSEREALQKYLRVGSLINVLQAKARLSLQRSGSRKG